MQYPNLFSPFTLGDVEVPNRVMMAAMSTGLSDGGGRVSDAQRAYYRERARGGVGLTVVEFACVDSRYGLSESHQLVLDRDDVIAGHAKLVRELQREGTVPGIQLQMPGQFAVGTDPDQRIAPSEAISPRSGEKRARQLTPGEIDEIIERFAGAARRAVEAGYKVIELHGAHGYLLHAFTSPVMNRRDDAWGGDEQRRSAFPTAVVRAVKDAIGDRPLLYRLSAEDQVPNSLTLDDTLRLVPRLVDAGVELIDVSTGSLAGALEYSIDPMSREGWRFGLAAQIRASTSVPVAVTGARTPAVAEQAIVSEKTDLVALGRPLLADPEWANKARNNDVSGIRPCTSCNWCAHLVFKHEPTGCAENPRTGRELIPLTRSRPGEGKSIVVIGAGPGGLVAAIQADTLGFRVILMDRDAHPGGGLISSAAPPHKEPLNLYRDYLVRKLEKTAVECRFGEDMTASEITSLGPQAVIFAAGAKERPLGIPGEAQHSVRSAYTLLQYEAGTLERWPETALVYGGGETGCETVELLAENDVQVTLVTRSSRSQLARSSEPLYRKTLVQRLIANPKVTILDHSTIESISETTVAIRTGDTRQHVCVDMVYLAQGRDPNRELHEALLQQGVRSIPIGDAHRVGRIGDAVHDANRALASIIGDGTEPHPA